MHNQFSLTIDKLHRKPIDDTTEHLHFCKNHRQCGNTWRTNNPDISFGFLETTGYAQPYHARGPECEERKLIECLSPEITGSNNSAAVQYASTTHLFLDLLHSLSWSRVASDHKTSVTILESPLNFLLAFYPQSSSSFSCRTLWRLLLKGSTKMRKDANIFNWLVYKM